MEITLFSLLAAVFTALYILSAMMSDSLRFASFGIIKEMLQKKFGHSEETLSRYTERMNKIFTDDEKNLRELEWATSLFLLLGLCFMMRYFQLKEMQTFGSYIFSKEILIYLGIVFFCSSILLRTLSEPFSEKIIWYLYPMWLMIHYVMKPLTLLIDTLQEIVLRMIGHKVEEEEEEHEQKILDSVDEGDKAGVFEDAERKMIENLIEFKDRDAGEVMTPRTEMIAISVDEGVKKVVEAMKESKLSRILIYKENRDNIIGFVHVRDLLPYWDHTEPLPHLNVLMHDPYLVPVSKSIRSLFQEFKDQHLHIAVVLDEYGGTAGLISLEDILEEIVGEIVDEHEDEEEMMYKVIGSGEIIVNARLRIDELNEVFETEIEENEQFDSVGGLLISQLGRIPTEGEQGELAELNLFYKISKANERKIDEVVFKKLEEKIES